MIRLDPCPYRLPVPRPVGGRLGHSAHEAALAAQRGPAKISGDACEKRAPAVRRRAGLLHTRARRAELSSPPTDDILDRGVDCLGAHPHARDQLVAVRVAVVDQVGEGEGE